MHIWTGGENPDPATPKVMLQGDIGKSRNRGVQVQGRQFHTRNDMYSRPDFGDMFSNLTASYDPLFWPIHSNVDRLWLEWLAMGQGRANPSEFLDSFTESHRYIVDYLLDEVLARQSETVQTFLMETALLNRLCGPLCEAVTRARELELL